MYYIINKDELYHHGIQGQKWGVRRFQTESGALTSEGKQRYAKYQKKIDRANRERDTLLSTRERVRDRKEARYEKRLSKLDENSQKYENKKKKYDAKLKDFDAGTKALKSGYKKYTDIIKDFGKAKIKSLDNPEYKKTYDYKIAKKTYNKQKMSDLTYNLYYSYGPNVGRKMTVMNYAATSGAAKKYWAD